jgi:hypothetical protein
VAEIQQQIADGARPRLARVGDVIEHGQDIPANVVRFADREGSSWRRMTAAPLLWTFMDRDEDADEELRYTLQTLQDRPRWWPLKVVEVDPEPQPAEPGLRDQLLSMWQEYATSSDVVDDAHLVRWVNALIENLGYASRRLKRVEAPESGPLVLTLPQVPDGAVALIGLQTGGRYPATGTADVWASPDGDGVLYRLGDVLLIERPHGVTVEMAPPREPRTWEPIATESDLPAEVEVEGWAGTWHLMPGSEFYEQDGSADRTLAALRELGRVREVIEQ